MIGETVKVIIDRPLGTYHPKHKDIYYSVNYGYIPEIMAADGEEQDAYVLGIDEPIKEFTGKVIAIIHRFNDVEDKLVLCYTRPIQYITREYCSYYYAICNGIHNILC